MKQKSIALSWFVSLAGVLLGLGITPDAAAAQGGSLASTPIMGWNSWAVYGCSVSDSAIRSTADAMVSTGLKEAGYTYIMIDDCWQGGRDASGALKGNARFPDMRALGTYLHSKGLKFGLYSSPAPQTCAGNDGSYGHEAQDAKTFASWGVDLLRYELCGVMPNKGNVSDAFKKMHTALTSSGRPIVYSVCHYGMEPVWRWAPGAGANMWCTEVGEPNGYDSLFTEAIRLDSLSSYIKPGRWNQPSQLQIGDSSGLNEDEARSQMTLWSMLPTPLIMGHDITTLNGVMKGVLTNSDVIAVDQDHGAKPGHIVRDTAIASTDDDEDDSLKKAKAADSVFMPQQQAPPPPPATVEWWTRKLSDGSIAVAIFNRMPKDTTVTVKFGDYGFYARTVVRDLWAQKNIGTIMGRHTITIPKHGVALLKLRKP